MNKHNVIGVDLAKTVFQVAVMKDHKIISNKIVKRAALLILIVFLIAAISTVRFDVNYFTKLEGVY